MSRTPGPWHISTPVVFTISSKTEPFIAGGILDLDDARLIAAAPDTLKQRNELLEALENVESWAVDMPRETWDIVRAAIAKARGEKIN